MPRSELQQQATQRQQRARVLVTAQKAERRLDAEVCVYSQGQCFAACEAGGTCANMNLMCDSACLVHAPPPVVVEATLGVPLVKRSTAPQPNTREDMLAI